MKSFNEGRVGVVRGPTVDFTADTLANDRSGNPVGLDGDQLHHASCPGTTQPALV